MKAQPYIAGAMCAVLLTGCMNVNAFSSRYDNIFANTSVSIAATDAIVRKLFPLRDADQADNATLLLDAQTNKAARYLLGEGLEKLFPAQALLSLATLTAAEKETPLDFTHSVVSAALFAKALPLAYPMAPESYRQTVDGQLFIYKDALLAFAQALSLPDEQLETQIAELEYDEGNDGYLLPAPSTAAPVLAVLAAVADEDTADTVSLDLALLSGTAITFRTILTLRIGSDLPFGVKLLSAEPLPPDAAQIATAAYSFPSEPIYGENRSNYTLRLSLPVAEGLQFTQDKDGALLTLDGGLSYVTNVEAPLLSHEPRASLWISAAEKGASKPEASAYASLAAAQAGYGARGYILQEPFLSTAAFLGRNTAYVLRYTAVSAAESDPVLAKETIEHFLVDGGNGYFYHFVFRFRPGVTAQEQIALYEAAARMRFLNP